MNQVIIKQRQLQIKFATITKGQSTRYYLYLPHYLQSPHLNNTVKKCKYCKSYPFKLNHSDITQINQCELCSSINEYPMKYSLYEQEHAESSFIDSSYVITLAQKQPHSLNILLLIQVEIQQSCILMIIEALKGVVDSLKAKVAVLLIFRGELSVINFQQMDPARIILTAGVNIQQIVFECFTQLNVQKVEWLGEILQQLNKVKSKSNNNSCHLIGQILKSYYKKPLFNEYVLVWIGNIPRQAVNIPKTILVTVCILVVNKKLQNANLLMETIGQFNQPHFISHRQQENKLYYKIYQVFSDSHLEVLILGMTTVHTDQQYSGSLLHQPHKLINNASHWLEIATSTPTNHKIQVTNDYIILGAKKTLVINCEQVKNRRFVWHQKMVMISQALTYVLQKFYAPNSKRQMNYFFVRMQLQQFGERYENNTQHFKNVLKQVQDYFKQFQKKTVKMVLPFSLLYRKQLLFLFYPLWQGGILHHVDGYWLENGDAKEHLQWSSLVVGVSYSHCQKQLPLYYRLCIENQHFSYVKE